MKKFKKKCEYCNKEFRTRFPNQRFCSQRCWGRIRITRITRKCLSCGKEFTIIPARAKDGKGKYCSKNCFLQDIKNISNRGRFKKGHKGYINKGNFKKGNIPWNKNLTGYSLVANIGKHPNLETRAKMRKAKLGKKLSGKHKQHISEGVQKHPPSTIFKSKCLYVPDVLITAKNIRASGKYRRWRKRVVKRDSYICQHCHQKKLLHAHHKVDFLSIINEIRYAYSDRKITYERAMKYKFLWDLENGISLCQKCHKFFHLNHINHESN